MRIGETKVVAEIKERMGGTGDDLCNVRYSWLL